MKFIKDLMHLVRLFPPTQEPLQPDELVQAIQPIVDAFGSMRWATVQFSQDTALNATTVTWNAADIEPQQLWLIPYAQVHHDDGAASHTLWIEIFDGTRPIAVQTPGSIAANQPLPLGRDAGGRPLILRPAWDLRGRSATATGAGNTLFLTYAFVVIDVGERVWVP